MVTLYLIAYAQFYVAFINTVISLNHFPETEDPITSVALHERGEICCLVVNNIQRQYFLYREIADSFTGEFPDLYTSPSFVGAVKSESFGVLNIPLS